MIDQTSPKRTRRMAREPQPATSQKAASPAAAKATSKLDKVETMLLASTGASISEIMTATGWQQHSIRGAMAGALKKRGLAITSDKTDGVRRYRAQRPT